MLVSVAAALVLMLTHQCVCEPAESMDRWGRSVGTGGGGAAPDAGDALRLIDQRNGFHLFTRYGRASWAGAGRAGAGGWPCPSSSSPLVAALLCAPRALTHTPHKLTLSGPRDHFDMF